MKAIERHAWLPVAAFGAILLWQAGVFALENARERWPGSAYAPRVEALLAVCANATAGGPFAVVSRGGGSYSLATTVIGDVGHAGVVDLVCRLRHRPIGRQGLGWIVFAALLVLPMITFGAADRELRIALGASLLFRDLSISTYRNVDTVALFGTLSVLAIGIAILASGRHGVPGAVLAGGLCAALYAERSVLAYFAFVTAVVCSAIARVRWRIPAAFVAALGSGVLAWSGLMEMRLHTPGVPQGSAIKSHNTWGYLVTGIGFSPNPWGIRGSDPAVVDFLARFDGGPPLTMEHPENEARARRFILHVMRDEPLALFSVYVRRAPGVIAEFFSLGWFGALVCLLLFPWTWRRSSSAGRVCQAAVAGVCVCLCAQAIVLDPRPLFSNPLLLISMLLQFFLVLRAAPTVGRAQIGDPA